MLVCSVNYALEVNEPTLSNNLKITMLLEVFVPAVNNSITSGSVRVV